MDDVTEKSISFEAVKTSISQTKTGIVLRLAIHPDDLPRDLLLAPVGTRYGVAMVMIGDDEQPTAPDGAEVAIKAIKSSGLMCREKSFQDWMVSSGLAEEATEQSVASGLREYLGVSSRGDMRNDKAALDRFLNLRAEFIAWYKNQNY